MRVLLTGSMGQLGRCFSDRFPTDWSLLALDSKQLDICDSDAIE